MKHVARRAFVSGKVQGVWYRQSTREAASKLGITGWVKNLADGRVEALMTGEEAAVEQLIQWLHHGPPRAEVTKVVVSEADLAETTDFSIR